MTRPNAVTPEGDVAGWSGVVLSNAVTPEVAVAGESGVAQSNAVTPEGDIAESSGAVLQLYCPEETARRKGVVLVVSAAAA